MIRSELKSRILDGINDAGPTIFTGAQLEALIDEAADFVVAETRSVKRTCFVPFRAGATFYSTLSCADDMMFPYRLWSQANDTRLVVTSMSELDGFMERWQDSHRTPEMWFPVAWDMFGIWPSPAEAGGVLRIDYLAWPRSQLDDNDESELPLATHDALVLYGQYLGLLKEWDSATAQAAFQSLQQHSTFANARSGILRVAHRSFQRSGLHLPHEIRSS